MKRNFVGFSDSFNGTIGPELDEDPIAATTMRSRRSNYIGLEIDYFQNLLLVPVWGACSVPLIWIAIRPSERFLTRFINLPTLAVVL